MPRRSDRPFPVEVEAEDLDVVDVGGTVLFVADIVADVVVLDKGLAVVDPLEQAAGDNINTTKTIMIPNTFFFIFFPFYFPFDSITIKTMATIFIKFKLYRFNMQFIKTFHVVNEQP